ncbi:MAG: O-antigen ligase family protein [Chloroflexi bacterium]|nr:O-antigen ligase family protein [Chloroflexota bacterium]
MLPIGGIKLFLFLLLGLVAAYALAQAVVALTAGFTIGTAFRALLLPSFLIGLLLLVVTWEEQQSWWGSIAALPEMVKPLLFVLILGLPIAFLVSYAGPRVGMTIFLVGAVAFAGAVLALVLVAVREGASGVVAFFLTVPFLRFLELSFKQTPFEGFFWGPLVVTPTVLFTWTFFLSFLVGRFVRRQHLGGTALSKYIFVWIGVVAVASLFSQDVLVTFRELSLDLLVAPLVFWVVVNSVRRREDILWAVGALAVYGVLTVSIYYYFFARWYGFGITIAGSQRVYLAGFGLHPALLGWTATLAIPLLVGLAFWGFTRRPLLALLLGGVAALLGAVLLFLGERTFPVALIGSMGLLVLLPGPFPRKQVVVALAIGVVALLIYTGVSDRAVFSRFGAWGGVEAFLEDQRLRLDFWQASWRIALEHPWTGVGMGEIGDSYLDFTRLNAFEVGGFGMVQPHNEFLRHAAGAGFGALLALVLLLGRILWGAWRSTFLAVQAGMGSLANGVLWALSAATLVLFIGQFSFSGGLFLCDRVEFQCGTVDHGIAFWALVGLAFALRHSLSPGKAADEEPKALLRSPAPH